MFRILLLLCSALISVSSFAQLATHPGFHGIYFQWGYNRDRYSKSTIHFWDEGKYNFTLHDVKAKDRPDWDSWEKHPLDITIPQNSVRLGVYLNREQTHAIELNFDHAKYVVTPGQRAYASGYLEETELNKDTTLVLHFIDFEHSNGANFLMLNYVGQHDLWRSKKRKLVSCVWKLGGGIVIPRSDVRIQAVRRDNKYHVAGYVLGTEGGFRFYILKNLFLEATGKIGYANYLDVLTIDGGKASHNFCYGEVIGLLGFDFNRGKRFKVKYK